MVLQGAWLIFGYSDRPGKSRAGGGTRQNTAHGGFARLSPTEPGDTGVPPSLLHCSGPFPKSDFAPSYTADRDTQTPKIPGSLTIFLCPAMSSGSSDSSGDEGPVVRSPSPGK